MKFRRQVPLGNYILDFFSFELKLAIEVQGYSHTIDEIAKKDVVRKRWLQSQGLVVLEIDDKGIFCDIDNVISEIQYEINKVRGDA